MKDDLPLLRRRILQGAGGAALALSFGRAARADAWPTRAVTIIVPLSPGGPPDVLSRILAQGIQERTRHPAVVDNRTGANGNIGIDAAARAAADGYTLLCVPAGNLTINPTLIRNWRFDVEASLAPVALLGTAPNVIAANPALPFTDLAGLIAYAKAQPQGISFATPGVGSQLHLAGELLAQRAGIELLHVPYRGSGPALADTISGQVQLLLTNLPSALPSIQDGKLRAIALTTAARSPAAPQIPTMAEAGVPDFDILSWYGLFAPRATPASVLEAITLEVRRTLSSPPVRQALHAQGLTVTDETGAALGARIRHESAMWAEVIRSRNIDAGF